MASELVEHLASALAGPYVIEREPECSALVERTEEDWIRFKG